MLNQLQQVTLYSFLRALVELDSPLPAQLQREINEVGKMYQTQPDEAINYLIKLAESDVIKKPYQQARINI